MKIFTACVAAAAALLLGASAAGASASTLLTRNFSPQQYAVSADGHAIVLDVANRHLGSHLELLERGRRVMIGKLGENATFGLSRDGGTLVYTPFSGPQRVVVRDLRTGRVKSFRGYSVWGGNFPLSADSRFVAVRRGSRSVNHDLTLREAGELDLRTGRYIQFPHPASGGIFETTLDKDGGVALYALNERSGFRWMRWSRSTRSARLIAKTSPPGAFGAAAISDDGNLMMPLGLYKGRSIIDAVTGRATTLGGEEEGGVLHGLDAVGDVAVFSCGGPRAPQGIFSYSVATGLISRVATVAADLVSGALTPDGRSVLFAAGPNAYNVALYSVPTAGATPLGSAVPSECLRH